MAHHEYPVQPFGVDFPPPGPDPLYHRNGLLEKVVQGPADDEFARWWRKYGENMPEYVADCRLFMGYILDTVWGMQSKLRRSRIYRSSFVSDLDLLIRDIGVWMDGNSRVTSGLERLHDAPDFSREERREFQAEMALYRRADAGRRLVKAHYDRLGTIKFVDDPLIAERLEALIRPLREWRADA